MLHPLFKCFGSKWSSSKHLPLPIFNTIIEPFAGGAGYSLRHHESEVILYERDPHVYALWTWLIQDADEFAIREIPTDLPAGTDIRCVGLSTGQELLLKHWQRTNNVGSCWTTSKWGHLPGQWTANTRARVAEEVQGIKHWSIVGDDGFNAFDDEECTWFIDPPYEFNYKYRQPPINYFDLAIKALNLRGQVIVCEARDPETMAAPDYLPFEDWKSRVTSRRAEGNHTHSKELLWVAKQ